MSYSYKVFDTMMKARSMADKLRVELERAEKLADRAATSAERWAAKKDGVDAGIGAKSPSVIAQELRDEAARHREVAARAEKYLPRAEKLEAQLVARNDRQDYDSKSRWSDFENGTKPRNLTAAALAGYPLESATVQRLVDPSGSRNIANISETAQVKDSTQTSVGGGRNVMTVGEGASVTGSNQVANIGAQSSDSTVNWT